MTPVPCHFCNKLIDGPDADGRWYAIHPADKAPWECYNAGGHRPSIAADPLSEDQRFQVDLAREKASRWFQDHGPDIHGIDRALADAIRDLLQILDQVAPEPKER